MSFIGRTLLRNAKTLCTQIVTQQQKSLVGARSLHCTSPMLNLFVQKKAPDFKGIAVVDCEFQEVKLSDYQGKYLVLFFYPLDFTFVCPTELVAFSKRIQEFKDLCAEVVGVSVDSHFAHLKWTNMERKDGGVGPLKYPILSDLTKKISRDYNVLLEDQGVALRGTFIIDDKGIVRSFSVNDLPVGRSVDEVLRLIKAFQFVDKNGEVCPANWDPKKNPATIKPDVDESKEYFDKHG